MAVASDSKPSPKLLEVPSASGQVVAIGPTDSEGVFVAFILGGGFQYLRISGKSHWAKAAHCSESVAGSFGLHVQSTDADGEAKSLCVSFVEGSLKTWICLRMPAATSVADVANAEEVGRTNMPSEVVAACSLTGDPMAVIALRNGAVRFMDLSNGKAAGKGLKLESQQSKGAVSLVRLAPYRVALVREAPSSESGAEFFVFTFDEESQKANLDLHGPLGGLSPQTLGPLVGVAAAGPTAGEDRVILCWQSQDKAAAGGTHGYAFASTVLNQETPTLAALPSAEGAVAWTCMKGYVAEWSPEAGTGGTDNLKLSVRDARFGMLAASGKMPLPARDHGAPLLVATAGDMTLIVGRTGSTTRAVGVQWLLPSFSLQMIVGRGLADQFATSKALGPLQEVVAGKRQRDDSAVEDMFNSKRHAATDKALADAVKRRSWLPSLELVNEVVYRRSWAAACALLSLPELDEDLSIKLLSARLELLSRVVRRAQAPHLLEHALRDNLPASQLPKVLEVLLQWLEAYRDFSEETLKKEAPGLPQLHEIITFLGALADGCLPMLAQLEVDLLERTLEAMLIVQKRSARATHLYAALREAYRIRKPLRPVTEAPAIEVVLFEDF